jgi:hypothetical protein
MNLNRICDICVGKNNAVFFEHRNVTYRDIFYQLQDVRQVMNIASIVKKTAWEGLLLRAYMCCAYYL